PHFLRKSLVRHRGGDGDPAAQKDASLVLVGSIASLGEFPGLFQYSATKQGIMGLFRSTKNLLLRPRASVSMRCCLTRLVSSPQTPNSYGCRYGALSSHNLSLGTKMVAGIIAMYEADGLPSNEPEDVADTFLHTLSSRINGEALYVTGAKTYEVEKSLTRVKGKWLGEALYDELLACQRALGSGDNWTNEKAKEANEYGNGTAKSS
ncbi:short chain dehydrogenase, partial [Apiospora phragmitis]